MTPGNWKYRKQLSFNGYYIESDTGFFIGETGGGIMHDDELLENTKLIAAAPDLLEALIILKKWVGKLDDWKGEDPPCELVDKAIDKATK